MPINWKSIWPRKRTTVVAATGNPQVLAALWRQPGVRVREARTADGVNDLLGEARLVILDGADLARSSLDVSYLAAALAQAQIPHTDSAGFLADPARWLGQADAFAGHIRSLPPRLVAFTALASGGVGKTTLTLGLALTVARRTHLPVAIVELAHGASGFLAVLDGAGFTRAADRCVRPRHARGPTGRLARPDGGADGRPARRAAHRRGLCGPVGPAARQPRARGGGRGPTASALAGGRRGGGCHLRGRGG